MNLTLQQLQQLFDESEPHTPMFVGKSGSFDKSDFLVRQIEDVKQSNQVILKEIGTAQVQLNEKQNFVDQVNKELRNLEHQLQQQIMRNKQLTYTYIKKHEDCFELKKTLMAQNVKRRIVTVSDLNATRPSECSTSPSPGMQSNLKRAIKKVISSRSLEFIVQEQLAKLLLNDSFQLSEPSTPKLGDDETIQLQKQLLELVQQNQQYANTLNYIQEQKLKQDLIYENMIKQKQRLQNQLNEQMRRNQQLQEECDLKDREEKELQSQLAANRPKKRLFTQQSVAKVVSFNKIYENNIKKNSVIFMNSNHKF